MKISITNDSSPVHLNTLKKGMLFRNVVGTGSFVVMDAARGFEEADGVEVLPLASLGLTRLEQLRRVSGHTQVVRLYITDITLTETPTS